MEVDIISNIPLIYYSIIISMQFLSLLTIAHMPINDIFSVAVYTCSRVHTDIQQTHDNTEAVQEHTGTLHEHTHTHTRLVLKFVSTPAAHILRFTHTVSSQ